VSLSGQGLRLGSCLKTLACV